MCLCFIYTYMQNKIYYRSENNGVFFMTTCKIKILGKYDMTEVITQTGLKCKNYQLLLIKTDCENE